MRNLWSLLLLTTNKWINKWSLLWIIWSVVDAFTLVWCYSSSNSISDPTRWRGCSWGGVFPTHSSITTLHAYLWHSDHFLITACRGLLPLSVLCSAWQQHHPGQALLFFRVVLKRDRGVIHKARNGTRLWLPNHFDDEAGSLDLKRDQQGCEFPQRF